MSGNIIENFHNDMLEKLQAKIKELNLYDKESYTLEELKTGTALITAFTALENVHNQYQDTISFTEEVLRSVQCSEV